MEVPITQFRRDIFSLVSRALEGKEVWIKHKGRRFKIVPENQPASRLGRITPIEIMNPDDPGLNDPALKAESMSEMQKAWERDWSKL